MKEIYSNRVILVFLFGFLILNVFSCGDGKTKMTEFEKDSSTEKQKFNVPAFIKSIWIMELGPNIFTYNFCNPEKLSGEMYNKVHKSTDNIEVNFKRYEAITDPKLLDSFVGFLVLNEKVIGVDREFGEITFLLEKDDRLSHEIGPDSIYLKPKRCP